MNRTPTRQPPASTTLPWVATARPDPALLAQARSRQDAFFKGTHTGVPVALFYGAPLSPAQAAIPNLDLKTAWNEPEQMLAQQLRMAAAMFNAGGDAVPAIRANFGAGILASCLGLEQEVFPDKMPWLQRHLTRDELARLTPDDIRPRGSFARAMEYCRFFREQLGDTIPVFCLDTQGPFDLAHLLLGDDLYLLLYDDPALAHHLLELCLALGTRAHAWCKEAIGEPRTSCHHFGLYSTTFGIRICEDSSSLICKEHIDAFVIPYSTRLAQAFGGAYAHYCGRNDYLSQRICETQELKALNFGHVPGKVQDHGRERFEATMELCEQTGTRYVGSWPRYRDPNGRPVETAAEWLARLRHWSKRGVLLPHLDSAGMVGPEGYETHGQLWKAWIN